MHTSRIRLNGRAAAARRRAGRSVPFLLAALLWAPSGPALAQQAPTLRVVEASDPRELVLELGPLELSANATHQDVRQPPAQTATIPVDGWIHGFRVEIIDGEGNPVPQEVLHHVNVISPDQRELFSQIMLRIAAAGQETAPARLPRLIGYRVREGQRVLVTAMFHNPTPRAYHGAVLRVHLPYTPGSAWLRPISGFPFYLDVMPPASVHAYDLPPGRSSKSWEGSPAVPGRILGVGGHLHKYGVALRLEDVTAGEVLWEARPVLDEDGDVIGMPVARFFRTLGIPIRPDHVYRLTAIYDNPTGDTIPDGAMGALGGVFLPARGASWPAADPDHPEYRLDVELLHTPYDGHGGHGAHGTHGDHGTPGAAGHDGGRPDAEHEGHERA
ncbi:MAG TPA: hypothetical protein VF158_15550 [Longimicrobiales bacterium]